MILFWSGSWQEGTTPSMHVVKRDGRREPVMFDKITARIRRLCWGLDERYIDPVLVAQKVLCKNQPMLSFFVRLLPLWVIVKFCC